MLILKVQLSSAKSFGTVEKTSMGWIPLPHPYHLGLNGFSVSFCIFSGCQVPLVSGVNSNLSSEKIRKSRRIPSRTLHHKFSNDTR